MSTIATGATPDIPHVEGLSLAVAKTDPKVLLAGGGIKYQATKETTQKTDIAIQSWSFAMRSRDGGDTWEWLPFTFLMVLSALQTLPEEYSEAALVDGANRLQIFYYVTLPARRVSRRPEARSPKMISCGPAAISTPNVP